MCTCIIPSIDFEVALGGDQLTVERIRNAQLSRVNSEDSSSALQGLLPFASDWHAEVNFMQVYALGYMHCACNKLCKDHCS